MNAIAVLPGSSVVRLVERAEPKLTDVDEIKIRIIEVGICGTDREEASDGRAAAQPGQKDLVIGHEMFGQVVGTGRAVKTVQVGEYAVFTVRRGCGRCPACAVNRSDMCTSGDYTERGIKGRDGYQTESVVDREQYVVNVPPDAARFGVLAEPMSVAEKAIDEVVRIQSARLPFGAAGTGDALNGQRALVAGLGPIGLLAAFALRLRGAEVIGLDVVDANTARPQLLNRIGGTYVDGRRVRPDALDEHFGQIDVIFEATGVAQLEFDLLSALGINGAYVLTGIPGGDRPIQVDAPALVRQLVLRNQVMIGSVNASPAHFRMAVDDLRKAASAWPDAMARVITDRLPYTAFADALTHHPADEIKTVLTWSQT